MKFIADATQRAPMIEELNQAVPGKAVFFPDEEKSKMIVQCDASITVIEWDRRNQILVASTPHNEPDSFDRAGD